MYRTDAGIRPRNKPRGVHLTFGKKWLEAYTRDRRRISDFWGEAFTKAHFLMKLGSRIVKIFVRETVFQPRVKSDDLELHVYESENWDSNSSVSLITNIRFTFLTSR